MTTTDQYVYINLILNGQYWIKFEPQIISWIPGEKEEISIFLGYLQIQSAHIADMIEMEGGWNNQNRGRWGGGGGLGQGKL
jgi:hypothetical protein